MICFHHIIIWLKKNYKDKDDGGLRIYTHNGQKLLLQLGKDDSRDNFTDDNVSLYFAYLVDSFEIINILNLKLQRRNTNIIIVNDSINSFLEKLQLWKRRVNKENFVFPSTEQTSLWWRTILSCWIERYSD